MWPNLRILAFSCVPKLLVDSVHPFLHILTPLAIRLHTCLWVLASLVEQDTHCYVSRCSWRAEQNAFWYSCILVCPAARVEQDVCIRLGEQGTFICACLDAP